MTSYKSSYFCINAKNNYPRWKPSEAAMLTRHNMTHNVICSIHLNYKYSYKYCNSSIHSHHTRGKTELHIHITTHTFAKQCLRQNIPVLLNNSPSSITDKFLTHSIQGFSNYVNNNFVNKYQQHCTILICYMCQL